MTDIYLDNSGNGPLQVPGFGDVPLDYQLPCEDRFANGFGEWRQAPVVTACELRMVATMNTITDKPNWFVDVNDDEIVARWRTEAFEQYADLGEKAWDWCLTELRDKANEYRNKGFIRVLDTGSCVCKSDTSTGEALSADLISAMHELYNEQEKIERPPGEQVLNIVDPLMFPLVYGKTQTLREGGAIGLTNMFRFGKHATKRAPVHIDPRTRSAEMQRVIDQGRAEYQACGQHCFSEHNLSRYHWSSNFQCLPCEVAFDEKEGTDVTITSYINNLHPGFKGLYRTIEKLISSAIEPWNECLIKSESGQTYHKQKQRGRVPLRIVTFGASWEYELPKWALSFDEKNKDLLQRYIEAERTMNTSYVAEERHRAFTIVQRTSWLAGSESIPEPTADTWAMAKGYLESAEPGSTSRRVLPNDWEKNVWTLINAKANRLERFVHPQPGVSFSYEDWKVGRNVHQAVVSRIAEAQYMRHSSSWEDEHFYNLRRLHKEPAHERYKICIQDIFREKGLQVIVKIGGIELTPDNPKYAGGAFEVEGHLNEHIVASAVFAYDTSNVTPCRMEYRQVISMDSSIYRYQQHIGVRCKLDDSSKQYLKANRTRIGELYALAETFGLEVDDIMKEQKHYAPPYQKIGSVELRQGRLVTFPNVMESRLQPFEVVDPTKKGHHRCVTLYLVDPNYRICSTRNVPPQQPDWWTAAVSPILMQKGLPRELADEISLTDWLMNNRKAERIKRKKGKELGWSNLVRRCQMKPFTF